MKYKILIIVSMLAIMSAMIGNAVAATEQMTTSFDGTYIQTDVSDLQDEKWYVLRYYPPGTLTCNSDGNIPDDTNCNSQLDVKTPPPGYIAGTPQLTPPNSYNEQFEPTSTGWWIVSLWHSGSGTGGDETLIISFKLYKPVEVPIPKFPTIAMPIAAMIGLVFLFQRRKNKEE